MYHMLLWLLWQLYSFFRLNRPELFSYIVTYKQYELVSAFLDVTLKRILHFTKEKMACSFLLSAAIFFSYLSVSGTYLYQPICYLQRDAPENES